MGWENLTEQNKELLGQNLSSGQLGTALTENPDGSLMFARLSPRQGTQAPISEPSRTPQVMGTLSIGQQPHYGSPSIIIKA